MPLRTHELFRLSKCPNRLLRGHSLERPRRTHPWERRPPPPGYSSRTGQRPGKQLLVPWWATLGPGAGRCLQPARVPLRLGTRLKSHPAQGAGDSQASGGRSSGFPPRSATPGGHQGSLAPLPCKCGLVYTLGGGSQEAVAAPARRAAARPGVRSASSGWSPLQAGTARRPSRASRQRRAAECPGCREPQRPAASSGLATALPRAE